MVQTGDQLDRGDQEQEILDLFERLRIESEAAGGAFHALLGNHELMNARLDSVSYTHLTLPTNREV